MDIEIVDIDLDGKGELATPKNDKIALIDADTIAYASCSVLEEEHDVLPESMLSEEELIAINNDPTLFTDKNGCKFTYSINLESAFQHSMDKINYILEQTGCQKFELHFTGGRDNFRFKVYEMYKSNRVGEFLRSPAGLKDLKQMFVDKGMGEIHTEWEADDAVVAKKRFAPDKYILCAVDKDVIYSVQGTHWNYYSSEEYNIPMKWVEVDLLTAQKHHYHQTITGDSGDNVPGIHGVGKVGANKILKGLTSHMEMWEAVVAKYEEKGLTVIDAITTMRLVSMHQVTYNDKDGYVLNLWKPLKGL